MNNNKDLDSFTKGKAFEDYVEHVLFPESNYELLHKTNSYDQNNKRYVGNSRKPDFRFKCKLTGREFHVEAKYRTNSYKKSYDVLSPTQLQSFQDVHTINIPIFISLGYGGTANQPEYISLIPYQKVKEQFVSIEDALKYQIKKENVESSFITALFPNQEIKNENVEDDSIEDKTINSPNTQSKYEWLNFRNIGIAASFVLLALLFINSALFTSDESEIQERVSTYYQLLDSNQVNELSNFISPNIHSWYNLKNPTFTEVKADINKYRDKYPYTITKVNWKTFKVVENENGEFYTTYSMEYKVKSKMNAPYKTYDLDILTIWDKQMKLIGANEVKR